MRNRILSLLLLCLGVGIPYGIWYYYDHSRISWSFEYHPQGSISLELAGVIKNESFPLVQFLLRHIKTHSECQKSPCTLTGILPILQNITLSGNGKKTIVQQIDFSKPLPQQVFQFEGILKVTEIQEGKASKDRAMQAGLDQCRIQSNGIEPRIYNEQGCIVVRTDSITKKTEVLHLSYKEGIETSFITYPSSLEPNIQNSKSNRALFTYENQQQYITMLWGDGFVHELPPQGSIVDGYMIGESLAILTTSEGPGVWNIRTGKFILVGEFDVLGIGKNSIVGFVSGTTDLQDFLYPNQRNILVKKSLLTGTRSVLGAWTQKDTPIAITLFEHGGIFIETPHSLYSIE